MLIINDIEELKNQQQQIVELQQKIEELKEVKLLKEKKQKEMEILNKIKKFSTFDLLLVGNTIAKLMSEFEGISYHCVENKFVIGDCDYLVEPQNVQRDFFSVYPRYKLKKINSIDFFDKQQDNLLTFLFPSSFTSNLNLSEVVNNINIFYVQYFIDFLYEKRASGLLYEITDKDLEVILQEFLLITKDLQQQRKEEVVSKLEERLSYKQRVEFEKRCLIDRKLIYNSLIEIINNYENNVTATEEYKKEWSRSGQWSNLCGYHNLIIQNGDDQICFKTEIDRDGCFPDEEYCGVYVDLNKDTDICFFDLKKAINPITHNCLYVKKFMDEVEKLYDLNKNISFDDVQQIFTSITNEKDIKTKSLKKVII